MGWWIKDDLNFLVHVHTCEACNGPAKMILVRDWEGEDFKEGKRNGVSGQVLRDVIFVTSCCCGGCS